MAGCNDCLGSGEPHTGSISRKPVEQAEFWLHDGHRQHEKECLETWKGHFHFSSSLLEMGKGIWMLKHVRQKETVPARVLVG